MLILVVLGVTAGCSGDGTDEGAPVNSTTTLLPSSTGDRCDDPTGDLDVPAGVPAEAQPLLAGVDLVSGDATVDGDVLAVRFETAGPVATVPTPTFVVAQGDPLQPFSFEIRLTRELDAWDVTLITWPDAREKRQALSTPVSADGTTVAVDVPLDALPPIALSLQFGAASEVSPGVFVIDDCSSLSVG